MSNCSNPVTEGEEFKIVNHKKKSKPKVVEKINSRRTNSSSVNRGLAISRIEEAKRDLKGSDIFQSFVASLKEGITLLENPCIKKIICLGLGSIGELLTSKYQFALLLCLKDLYNVDIEVFDPIFNEDDYFILKYYKVQILVENLEGKYRITDKCTTIFYMPHCCRQLTNNLLWANWGLNLNYCIIISNSFNDVIEQSPKRLLIKSAQYILSIFPYTVELAIANNFKYYNIFNDSAIHLFPWNKLSLISDDFWKFCIEPKYEEGDLEFITNSIECKFNIA